MADKPYDVRGASEYLQLCRKVVYALAAAREIGHYRVGQPGRRGKIMFLRADLDAYLASRRVEEKGPAAPKPRPAKTVFKHLQLPN